jgi:hypothetical protein
MWPRHLKSKTQLGKHCQFKIDVKTAFVFTSVNSFLFRYTCIIEAGLRYKNLESSRCSKFRLEKEKKEMKRIVVIVESGHI